jgi:hypothetical protein
MRCVKKHGVSEIQHIPLTNLVRVPASYALWDQAFPSWLATR